MRATYTLLVAEADEEEPIELDDVREAGRELAALRPFSDADVRGLLHRYLSELHAKSGKLTPKEQAKLALLMEFCVDDD